LDIFLKLLLAVRIEMATKLGSKPYRSKNKKKKQFPDTSKEQIQHLFFKKM